MYFSNIIYKLLLKIECVIFVRNISAINIRVYRVIWAGILAAHLQVVCSVGSVNKTVFTVFYVIPQLFTDKIIILLPNIKKWTELRRF